MPDSQLAAAHYYHLHNTLSNIKPNSGWASTGRRAARRKFRIAKQGHIRRYNANSVTSATRWRGDDHKAVAVFFWRTEMAYLKNRDEFAGLMRNRVALRCAGHTNEETADWLGLSRRELAELDSIIVGEEWLRRLPRSKHDGPIPALLRKMKNGVASDILRRKRLSLYNPSQPLTPQPVSPLSR